MARDREIDNLVVQALEAQLQEFCSDAQVLAIEKADDPYIPGQALWHALEASGIANAGVPEEQGGAGMDLESLGVLLDMCGSVAMPLPLGDTLLARALLAQAGVEVPTGSIALADEAKVGLARVADWVLLEQGQEWLLLPLRSARLTQAGFVLDALVEWSVEQQTSALRIMAPCAMRMLRAMVLAGQLAGAAMQVFSQTLTFANQREQFGRPIGKFQAIQHQLSVLAEHAFAASMCRQMACLPAMPGGLLPDPRRVAIAKARASEAALEIAQLSHSIHGAIGFTQEYSLQLFTRRLHAWRQGAGAEAWWYAQIGKSLLDADQSMAVEFIGNSFQ